MIKRNKTLNVDLLLVNLTRAYILNIESKSRLVDTKKTKKGASGKFKPTMSGHRQLGLGISLPYKPRPLFGGGGWVVVRIFG